MFILIACVATAGITFLVFCAVMLKGVNTSPSLIGLEDLEQMRALRQHATRGRSTESERAWSGSDRSSTPG